MSTDNTKKYDELKWSITGEKNVLSTRVFDVIEQTEKAASGIEGKYMALSGPDWVMVVPVKGDDFILVRQWRHGSQSITLEFPGGVIERGEDPAVAAARELEEETGCRAGKLTFLGSCSPNPALFRNKMHFFLAEELVETGVQHLDRDELLRYETVSREYVLKQFGKGEFSHALFGTALAFYLQDKYIKSEEEH